MINLILTAMVLIVAFFIAGAILNFLFVAGCVIISYIIDFFKK